MDTQVNASPGEGAKNKKPDKRKTKYRDLIRKEVKKIQDTYDMMASNSKWLD